jgi:signal-transduction protein with cAMP-binding, CBS, and nucleotidyltransferase domain
MIICPFCDAENIEGVDECDTCHQALTDLSLPVPATAVEIDLLRDRIRLLGPRIPSTVPPAALVGDVLKKMAGERIGCVLVVERGRLVGIFSERDALMKLNTDAVRLAGEPISKYMTPDPETLSADDRIAFALHKMDVGGYRHLPILDDSRLVGVISIRDILDYLTERIAAGVGR